MGKAVVLRWLFNLKFLTFLRLFSGLFILLRLTVFLLNLSMIINNRFGVGILTNSHSLFLKELIFVDFIKFPLYVYALLTIITIHQPLEPLIFKEWDLSHDYALVGYIFGPFSTVLQLIIWALCVINTMFMIAKEFNGGLSLMKRNCIRVSFRTWNQTSAGTLSRDQYTTPSPLLNYHSGIDDFGQNKR